ncbi:hypothetical protein Q6348_14970 [Isoptericola sp. b441]|uniref:Glycosyltransferase RgtA/B/C/D-like domain-containing protein n=1 Tax=Actinotalea lenta TaxID=3064654 RepID=A0ABT9DC98_9CELL|nr:hypothetical protein [Isoptericola sp. b441]MDO8108497.1 hypothetical protein [Isoptericola sp. b441]
MSVWRSRAVQALRLFPLGLMAATAFVAYAVIVWTLPRGFDWTDEAFVDVMIASNRVAVGEPWGFQHLLNPLYVLTGESVLALRIMRLGGYVLLSVALVLLARAILRRLSIAVGRSGWLAVLLIAQVGTFVAWSYPPRYLSHNELASWLSQIGVALALLSLAWGLSGTDARLAARALWPVWLGLGAATALLVFAKVTSGVAFAAVLALIYLVPNSTFRAWKRGTAAGAGAAAVLLLLWGSGYPIRAYWHNVTSLFLDPSAQADFDHPISELVAMYGRTLADAGKAVLPALALFALAMVTARLARRHSGGGAWRWASWLLGALLVVALLRLPKVSVWDYLGALIVFLGLAGVIGLLVLRGEGATTHGSAAHRRIAVAAGGIALTAAPFISAVGTNNNLPGQFLFAATLWAVLLGVALVLLAEHDMALRSPAQVIPVAIVCTLLLMSALAVKASADEPYRTPSLWSQDTTTSAPEFRGMLLTKGEAEWMDWMSNAGKSLHADGVPTIAISSPGALYAFNHSGYANPRIESYLPVSVSSVRSACRKGPPKDLFVLQPGTAVSDGPSTVGVAAALAECGIDFPGDFALAASREAPEPAFDMRIWRLAPHRTPADASSWPP